MLIIGIDPGISGALCFMEHGKIIDVIESPLPLDRPLEIRDSAEFLKVSQRVRE